MSEDISRYRYSTPAYELHAVFLCYELEKLHSLSALHLALREEEHSHTEITFAADIVSKICGLTYKEVIGHLHQYTDTVACFALGILAGTVLKLFDDGESTVHNVSGLLSPDIHYRTYAAVIVFKSRVIESLLLIRSFHSE